MTIKYFCVTAALGIAFAGAPALAQDAAAAPAPELSVTGSAAIVSQYRFRGIAQSDNKPAAQMAVTVTDKSGFYISAWGSSASSNGNDVVDIGGTEIDIYGGYSHTFKSGLTLDGGLYGYLYPGATAGEYYEVYGDASKSFGPIGFKVGANWAPKQHYFTYFDTATKYNMYEFGEITFSPPKLAALTFHTHLGHTGGGFNYTKEYLDYTVGVSYKWKVLTLDASLVGTNVSKSDARAAPLTTIDGDVSPFETYRAAKSVGVISLTASF